MVPTLVENSDFFMYLDIKAIDLKTLRNVLPFSYKTMTLIRVVMCYGIIS